MPATESSGTQTAVVGTEHTLASPTTAKTRVFEIDLGNEANGDTVELRISKKVLVGGTVKLVYLATYAHTQGEPIVISVPVPMMFGGTFTLKQTAGTARNYDWAILTLD